MSLRKSDQLSSLTILAFVVYLTKICVTMVNSDHDHGDFREKLKIPTLVYSTSYFHMD